MSAVFCAPKKFTVTTGSAQAQAPIANMNRDEIGYVWRSVNLSGVTFTVQLDGTAWDTFALAENNLRATDTIRLRAGSSTTVVNGTSAPLDVTFNAWTGTAPLHKAISFRLLASPVTHAYVRVDITSTGNPAGFVEVSKLVIGKRVETAGVNIGAERTPVDTSIVNETPGSTTIQRYRRRMQWKVDVGPINSSLFYSDWDRLFYQVGKTDGFLFIEDDASPWVQQEIGFVRNRVDPVTVGLSTSFSKMALTFWEV